jgi:hypothetical protein
MENLIKLKDLKEGDWFTKVSSEFKNNYKLIAKEVMPKFAGVECNNQLFEMETDTEVVKIDGFQLYLLQGGRTWD